MSGSQRQQAVRKQHSSPPAAARPSARWWPCSGPPARRAGESTAPKIRSTHTSSRFGCVCACCMAVRLLLRKASKLVQRVHLQQLGRLHAGGPAQDLLCGEQGHVQPHMQQRRVPRHLQCMRSHPRGNCLLAYVLAQAVVQDLTCSSSAVCALVALPRASCAESRGMYSSVSSVR